MDSSKKKPKKKRNWRKYNEFRTRDQELTIKTLKEEVSKLPVPYNLQWKGNGRPPVDFVSVVMCLLLKVIQGKSYRTLYANLRFEKSMRELAGIAELPHYNTINEYLGKIPTKYWDDLIRALYQRDKKFREKKTVVRLMGETHFKKREEETKPSMPQDFAPRRENSGTAFA